MTENTGSQASQASITGSRADRRLDAGVCLFSIDSTQFAIDTALVGEVTMVTSVLPVPRCSPAILGLFNLRGIPVAIVDLLTVLGQSSARDMSKDTQVLVLRNDKGPIAGLRVSQLDAVVPSGIGNRVKSENRAEHPAVVGFFEVAGRRPGLLLGSGPLVASLLQISLENNNS